MHSTARTIIFALAIIVAAGLLSHDHDQAHATPGTVVAGVEAAATAIKAVPGNMGDIISSRARPVVASEQAVFGQNVSTSPLNAFGNSAGTGPAETTWDDQITQNVRVMNLSASNTLCVSVLERSAANVTCNTTCTASGMTCGAAAATDGTPVAAGAAYTLPLGGKECACVEATAATTLTQATNYRRGSNQN